ncbi:MAG: hypothetical protein AAFQ94_09975 [Bacteroidota bacterium]
MKKIKGFLILVTILGYNLVSAQSVVSPYSILGVGDLAFEGFTHNQALGELGVGYSSLWHINHTNPAWLYRNSFSTFQVALEGENRRFASLQQAESSGTGGLRNLAISLPIVRGKFTTSFGILPFSTVNYNISTNQLIEGTEINSSTNLSGEGGLTQAFFSTGIKIGKNFGIGTRVKYVFGRIQASNGVIVNDTSIVSDFQSRFVQSTNYNDVNILGGISYRKTISEDRIINIGLTHELSAGLAGEREERIERVTINDFVVEADTLTISRNVLFEIPSSTAIGIWYEKANKYGIGIDLSIRNWSDNGGFENGTDQLRNAIKLSVGGEYIPTYNDVNSYFKRATYRAGISYEQLPYQINERNLSDFGINFGTSLPVGRYSSLDLAFKVGQRGTTDNELIRETYFKFVFGATINDNQWFVRRKYD